MIRFWTVIFKLFGKIILKSMFFYLISEIAQILNYRLLISIWIQGFIKLGKRIFFMELKISLLEIVFIVLSPQRNIRCYRRTISFISLHLSISKILSWLKNSSLLSHWVLPTFSYFLPSAKTRLLLSKVLGSLRHLMF